MLLKEKIFSPHDEGGTAAVFCLGKLFSVRLLLAMAVGRT
jgi:hypothetical protein